MALTVKKKLLLSGVLLLAFLILVLPLLLGLFLRARVEGQLREALNAPVRLGSLSVSVLPPGATLGEVEVGDPSALTGNQPLARLGKLGLGVSWGTVLGGELHLTSLTLRDADFHMGCDEAGNATLPAFLQRLPPGKRDQALPIDSLEVRESRIHLYVPKALVMPQSKEELKPVRIEVGSLAVDSLVLPAPGKAVSAEVETEIHIEGIRVGSPLAPPPQVAAEAGEALEEGIWVRKAEGKLVLPAALDLPLSLRGTRLEGLRVRSCNRDPHTPDTLGLILAARALCLRAPPPDPQHPGMTLGNGGQMVEDVTVEDALLQIDGPDAEGKQAWWRLVDLKLSVTRMGFGPGTVVGSDRPGQVRIASPSRSSEGEGQLLLEWTRITGSWPVLSFDKKLELKGVALTPFSARVEKAIDAKVAHGQLDTAFAGRTQDGRLNWDGSVTFSKSTRLKGSDRSGLVCEELAKAATGEPIKTIRVRGTLAEPDIQPPDFLAGAAYAVFRSVVADQATGIFGGFGSAMRSALGQGARETKKLMQKVPGMGGIFGGAKKEQKEEQKP